MTPAVQALRTSQAALIRLAADRELVEAHLRSLLDTGGPPASPFRQAVQYAVLGQGQRIRPILAMRIARLSGQDGPLALRAAVPLR